MKQFKHLEEQLEMMCLDKVIWLTGGVIDSGEYAVVTGWQEDCLNLFTW